MSEHLNDYGTGRVRPIQAPNYAQILALPDGSEVILVAHMDGEKARTNHMDDGLYATSYTMSADLRQEWDSRLPVGVPREKIQAGDLMFYLLPENYTADATGGDSTLSVEFIVKHMIEQYKPRIMAMGAGQSDETAMGLLTDILADTISHARHGYVINPF
jgi:hypothetical protein